MNIRADIDPATATAVQPFTAADYLAIERMRGHEAYVVDDNGERVLCVSFKNRKPWTEELERAEIAGMRRFRDWQDATPNWKEQVVAELERERAAA